jgi:hypothetical protein
MFIEEVIPLPTVGNEWIAPIITGIFLVIVAIVGALLARRGQKLSSREDKAPDVQEMWVQQEADRRTRQLVEDMYWTLRRMFQSYYRRVLNTIATMNLPPEKAALFEMTAKEKAAANATLPDED